MSKILNGELIGKRESVVDEILLLNEHQTPLLNLLGFSDAVSQVEHVWFEDEMFSDESTVSAGETDVAADATSIEVADVEPFRANQVVKVGEELLLVTNVNTANNTLTVTRGYADTTASTISDGTKIEVMFVEGEEGADARNARYKPRARKSNYTQIFDETISISRTASVVSQYGIDDLYEYEKQKKQLELALQLEKALINGVKYENGAVRQMGGLRQFVSTNVTDASAADITDAMINDSMQSIYEAGGFANGGNYKIIVPAKQKRAISGFQSSDVRLTRAENTRGQVVDFFVSDFGQAEIVLNNNLEANEMLIVDANRVSVHPLTQSEFTHEYLGKKGDYFEGQIVGEYTLQVIQEKAHARIKNLK